MATYAQEYEQISRRFDAFAYRCERAGAKCAELKRLMGINEAVIDTLIELAPSLIEALAQKEESSGCQA